MPLWVITYLYSEAKYMWKNLENHIVRFSNNLFLITEKSHYKWARILALTDLLRLEKGALLVLLLLHVLTAAVWDPHLSKTLIHTSKEILYPLSLTMAEFMSVRVHLKVNQNLLLHSFYTTHIFTKAYISVMHTGSMARSKEHVNVLTAVWSISFQCTHKYTPLLDACMHACTHTRAVVPLLVSWQDISLTVYNINPWKSLRHKELHSLK